MSDSTRAVIYARYSSDLQSENSLADQVRICKETIERRGWCHLSNYEDAAISGASRHRPRFADLIVDARAGKFDVAVAESLDRLSRDQEDVAHVYKQFTFAGARIYTLAEGWISELQIGLSGTMGALYLKQLADKTRRGLRGRVEAGRSGGGKSYGYDVVPGPARDGEPERGIRRRNDVEAEVIVDIFSAYGAGKSPRAIAKALNARSVPGPSGGTWSPSAINGNVTRGTGILNNELYAGRLVWNRLRYVKNPTTGKRQSRLNAPEDWIIKEVADLRIVPQELWDAVKIRQKAAAKATRPDKAQAEGQVRPFWEQQRPRYLLSGLMKCGCCGANYTKYGSSRFGCAGARDRGTCNNKLTIRGDDVEGAILLGLQQRLMEPAQFERFATEFVTETNRQRHEVSAIKAKTEATLARTEQQIRRLVDAITDGADAVSLNSKLKELEAERNRLASELADVVDDKPLLHPALAIMYRDRVAALAEALYDAELGPEAFNRMRALVEAVVLTPDGDQLTIQLRGALAGILRVAGDLLTIETADKNALQIKLVAGARNLHKLLFSATNLPLALPQR